MSFDCLFDKSIFDGKIFDTCEDFGTGVGEEPGIGLATPPTAARAPVDFIFYTGDLGQRFRTPRLNLVKRSPKREDSDLAEMMDLYARWRKAA